jgi:drug/metabolite transporter (DMT)-like permease
MSFIKLRLRYKLELIAFVAVCMGWVFTGVSIASDVENKFVPSVEVTLGFLGSAIAVIWWGGRNYQRILDEQKSTNAKLSILTEAMTMASGLAAVAAAKAEMAVTEAKTAASEAKLTRDHTDEQISGLDCQKSKDKKCARKKQ